MSVDGRLVIDVTKFGADPTGTKDSTFAIQTALDTAFGGASFFTPNNFGNGGKSYLNLPVYMPAGTYLITKTLLIMGVHGARIYGDGPNATILKWAGPVPGNTGWNIATGRPTGPINTLGAITGGSGGTPGTYTGISLSPITGSSTGSGAVATIVVGAGGNVTSVTITNPGSRWQTNDLLTASPGSVGGFSVSVASIIAKLTPMWLTNGFGRSLMHDFQIDMVGNSGSVLTDGTIGFFWTWDGGTSFGPKYIDANTSFFGLKNLFFRNATVGLLCGALAPIILPQPPVSVLPPNYVQAQNTECDWCTIESCFWDDCLLGLGIYEGNAVSYSIYGGSATNCAQGISGGAGVQIMQGVGFSGNTVDWLGGGGPLAVIGCNSSSQTFGLCQSHTLITGCNHTGNGANPIFLFTPTNDTLSVDNCNSTNGYFAGSGNVIVRDSKFGRADPFPASGVNNPFTGNVIEWRLPPGNFASLPATPHVGYEQLITDSTVTEFGATIAGSGGNTVLGRWNGAHWTVMGR
jgi:hypothetical protein